MLPRDRGGDRSIVFRLGGKTINLSVFYAGRRMALWWSRRRDRVKMNVDVFPK